MYTLIRNLLNYTGSYYQNVDQYIIYLASCIILLFFVVVFDLTYKMIRSFIRGR